MVFSLRKKDINYFLETPATVDNWASNLDDLSGADLHRLVNELLTRKEDTKLAEVLAHKKGFVFKFADLEFTVRNNMNNSGARMRDMLEEGPIPTSLVDLLVSKGSWPKTLEILAPRITFTLPQIARCWHDNQRQPVDLWLKKDGSPQDLLEQLIKDRDCDAATRLLKEFSSSQQVKADYNMVRVARNTANWAFLEALIDALSGKEMRYEDLTFLVDRDQKALLTKAWLKTVEKEIVKDKEVPRNTDKDEFFDWCWTDPDYRSFLLEIDLRKGRFTPRAEALDQALTEQWFDVAAHLLECGWVPRDQTLDTSIAEAATTAKAWKMVKLLLERHGWQPTRVAYVKALAAGQLDLACRMARKKAPLMHADLVMAITGSQANLAEAILEGGIVEVNATIASIIMFEQDKGISETMFQYLTPGNVYEQDIALFFKNPDGKCLLNIANYRKIFLKVLEFSKHTLTGEQLGHCIDAGYKEIVLQAAKNGTEFKFGDFRAAESWLSRDSTPVVRELVRTMGNALHELKAMFDADKHLRTAAITAEEQRKREQEAWS